MFFKKKYTPPRALVLWYPVGLNYGDHLIFQTVKKYLDDLGYQVIDMDVGHPYKEIAKTARKCDILWFAGGGIIERGVPDLIRNFTLFHKRSGRIPYGVTGLSIGLFDYFDSYRQLKYWVDNALFFYARDTFTACELNRISASEKVVDGVDVVFANEGIRHIETKDSDQVGINLRDLPYEDLSGRFDRNGWEKAFREDISGTLVGIPDQHDSMKDLDIPIDLDYAPDKVTETIKGASYVVAMRFHVILVAAMLGKVAIPIGYCPKVTRLAQQLGIEDLELGVHDFGSLKDRIQRYDSKKEEYKKIVSLNVKRMQGEADRMFKEIGTILKNGGM